MNAGSKAVGSGGFLSCRRCLRSSAVTQSLLDSSRMAATRNSRRPFSTESTLSPTAEPETIPEPFDASTAPQKRRWYDIAAGVVISRPPILTRDFPEFEQSFYFYQRRLNDRLQLPFARWFYFKNGTLAEDEWKRKTKVAKAGRYDPYGPRAWADELLVGDERHKLDPLKDYDHLVNTTVTGEEETMAIIQAQQEGAREAEARGEVVEHPTEIVEKPFPRVSGADIENNTKRLDRKMSRTLYLVVRENGRKEYAWKFPHSIIGRWENLRVGAIRTLAEAAGKNMNTWFVGSVPIGYYKYDYGDNYKHSQSAGKKVFFMKARILAGQADLVDNKLGLDDFQWLTKEEIEGVLERRYYEQIKNMLVSQ